MGKPAGKKNLNPSDFETHHRSQLDLIPLEYPITKGNLHLSAQTQQLLLYEWITSDYYFLALWELASSLIFQAYYYPRLR
jgi:hypothetical protein